MKKKYKFLRQATKKWETVEPEVWQWTAIFADGTTLKQFDDQGIFHQIAEVNQKELVFFKMTSPNSPQAYSIVFDPATMKLIHFYRNLVFNAATVDEKRVRLYCFGYEKLVGSEKSQVILTITPQNELIVIEDINQLSLEIRS